MSYLSRRKLATLAGLVVLALIVRGAPVSIDNQDATTCSRNCTNGTIICGSDGNTYLNDCELQHFNCMNKANLTIKHEGSCRNCTQYKHSLKRNVLFPNLTDDEYSNNYVELWLTRLIRCKKMDFKPEELLEYPFTPECYDGELNHKFKPTQQECILNWCVMPDGDLIPGTLSMSDPNCENRRECIVDDTRYADGTAFVKCGPCQCSNGNVSCINDYCGTEGSFSDDVFRILKDDMLQLFIYHYQHKHDIPTGTINLFYLRENRYETSTELKKAILEWNFDHYNSNKDDVLQESDKANLYKDIIDLIKTTSILKQLGEKLDPNGDRVTTRSEWESFFIGSDDRR